MIRGRSLNSRRRMIQARNPAPIKSGIQSTQSTAQRMKAFPRLIRPRSEFSQVRATWVGKSATAGGGGSNFSRSRTLRVSVARDERFSRTRILPSSWSISPRTRLSSVSILSTSSSLPVRSSRICERLLLGFLVLDAGLDVVKLLGHVLRRPLVLLELPQCDDLLHERFELFDRHPQFPAHRPRRARRAGRALLGDVAARVLNEGHHLLGDRVHVLDDQVDLAVIDDLP